MNTVEKLNGRDLGVGSIIALTMGVVFTAVGGLPLVLTFIPGIIFAWVAFFYIYKRGIALPSLNEFMPQFFITIAWQFIHFNEEFLTDFKTLFPVMYNAQPYSNEKFVTINMVSYFVFTISCIIFLRTKFKFFLFPVLFFITYGALGNAIAHPTWCVIVEGYFPGFYTSLIYWVLGPLVMYKLIPDRKIITAFIVLFAIVLIPLLYIFGKRSFQ